MRIIEAAGEMQQQAEIWRREGKKIAFAPTMGFLHEGHLSLMRHAREVGDAVVASIFVNPTQFGPGEDLSRYPIDVDRDRRLLEEAGVDALFLPRSEEMYPPGYQTYVEVSEASLPLCGKSRPGHFRGVATVVAKLFHIVKPHVAIFGEKDYQQLVIIRRMAQDLNMDVQVIGRPIVRESDGLAMSSRNTYLTPDQRKEALRLSRAIREAQALILAGEKRGDAILSRVREILSNGEEVRIDYVELREPWTLEEAIRVNGPTLLAIAAYVGATRLIDNCILHPPA
jgi:pantoate--beta-alanine ligase